MSASIMSHTKHRLLLSICILFAVIVGYLVSDIQHRKHTYYIIVSCVPTQQQMHDVATMMDPNLKSFEPALFRADAKEYVYQWNDNEYILILKKQQAAYAVTAKKIGDNMWGIRCVVMK